MSDRPEVLIPTNQEVAALDPVVRAEMAAVLLSGIEPGRQPLELFTQLCRLTVGSTVEVVPIRVRDEEPEVWLDRRSEADVWWPGKWALPGVMILPTDRLDAENSLGGPISRLFDSELAGVRQVGGLHQMPTQFRSGDRYVEVTTQYWTRVETGPEPYAGQFFNMTELRRSEPEGGVLEEGWPTINRAIAAYEATLT